MSKDHCCSMIDDESWLRHAPLSARKNEHGQFKMEERGSRVDNKIVAVWMSASPQERVAVRNILHGGSKDQADYKIMAGLMERVEKAADEATTN